VDDDLRCRDDAANSVRTKDYTVSDVPAGVISHWEFDATSPIRAEPGNDGQTFAGGLPVFGDRPRCERGVRDLPRGTGDDIVQVVINEELPIYSNPKSARSPSPVGQTAPGGRRIYAEGAPRATPPSFTIGGQFRTDVVVSQGTSIFTYARMPNTRPPSPSALPGDCLRHTWHHIAYVDSSGQRRLHRRGAGCDELQLTRRAHLTLDTTAIGGVLRAAAGNRFQGCHRRCPRVQLRPQRAGGEGRE